MAVQLTDNRIQVTAALNQAVVNALHESGFEVAAQANRDIQIQWEARDALRGSYSVQVDESALKAYVGTPREEGFWEEFGTGSHADTVKNGGIEGRTEWWVFVPYETPRVTHHINCIHRTEEEAKAVAASLRAEGKDAYATNGEKPHYTLEKSFIAKKPDIVATFKRKLNSGVT